VQLTREEINRQDAKDAKIGKRRGSTLLPLAA